MPFTKISLPDTPRRKPNLALQANTQGILSQAGCLVSPDNMPIFIIPGIHGKNLEITSIALALLRHSPDRPVYLYQDELYDSAAQPQPTLIEHAKTIADQILAVMDMSIVPLALVGYSFGGMLAVEVAKILEVKRDIPSPVFVLDGASKEASRTYYFFDRNDATEDMATIIDSAANMCGINPTGSTKADITRLSNSVNPIRRLDELARCVLAKNTPTPTNNHKVEAYKKIYRAVRQNINNICTRNEHEPETIPTQLSNLHIILTTETKNKLGHGGCGWEAHTKKLYTLEHRYLNDQPHLALLNEKNTPIIANMISNAIKKLMPVEYLTNLQIETLRKMNERAKKYQEITSSESSEASGEDYYSCSPPPEPIMSEQPESKKLKVEENFEFARSPVTFFAPPPAEPSPWAGISRALNKSH